MQTEKLIQTALNEKKPDLVLKNGKVVNVFTGEILSTDIAITDGVIVGMGSYQGVRETDLGGRYVIPGLINAHVHVESSMASPEVYAMEELRQGTTTIITDPHEIVNVSGMTAISDILKASERAVVNYYVMLPSCVPSTPFEHSGAVLEAEDLAYFKHHPNVLGLGEMMNAVGVLNRDEVVMHKLSAFSDQIVDGHFPMGSGKELNAYVSGGIGTDHESISFEEALEKLRTGMAVLIREGSACHNLDAIIQGIVENHIDTSHLAFCTDDKHLAAIRQEGSIRYHLKRSVQLGLDPVRAVQIATINAARIYGLKHIGAVGIGYKADMLVVNDLRDFEIHTVYKDGKTIDELEPVQTMTYSRQLISPVNFASLDTNTFRIPEADSYSVIGIVNHQIVTQKLLYSAAELKRGLADGSVNKIAVIERHHATGNHGVGYIFGYGNIHGAVASTVAHDSHNIVVIGDNDRDMFLACEELKKTGGGYILVSGGKVTGSLALPLGGLMSLKKADDLISELDLIIQKAYAMGVNPEIDPFITLSFMALPVIPELRITDGGLFDVTRFTFLK